MTGAQPLSDLDSIRQKRVLFSGVFVFQCYMSYTSHIVSRLTLGVSGLLRGPVSQASHRLR